MANGPDLNSIASYIWSIADDVLRDVYVRGKYREVILPMTVLPPRRGARTHQAGGAGRQRRPGRRRASPLRGRARRAVPLAPPGECTVEMALITETGAEGLGMRSRSPWRRCRTSMRRPTSRPRWPSRRRPSTCTCAPPWTRRQPPATTSTRAWTASEARLAGIAVRLQGDPRPRRAQRAERALDSWVPSARLPGGTGVRVQPPTET